MNIKSLLLGSAAALIAVSGARAADAVTVAEPEPAEYVKICDVYGAGYFYIPGTETCLRVGGYIRYDAGFGDIGSLDGRKTRDVQDGDLQSTWKKNARFALKTWTGQETELGTLKTYTETRFNFPNGGPSNVSLNFAWIQLGGLRVGKDESVYDSFIGYAGNVIQDTIIPYGIKDTDLVSYYFDAGNGFSGVISLEEGSDVTGLVTGTGTGIISGTIDSYVPHVVGGVKYKGDWGAVTGVVAYDSAYEEVAGKVRLDVNVTKELTLFIMGGYGTDDNFRDTGNTINTHGRGFYKPWGGNWAVWGGGTYKFDAKTSFNLQASADDDKNYAVAANIAYTIVPGFTITGEVDWDHFGRFDDGLGDTNVVDWTKADKKNSVGGIVRFQRNF
ncbi:porin [Mesorhizobium sp. B2-9-1]|uniref:porin n=1 Tax=unclassified Mesorhizobium TaxID=325217 RepID=UPI001129B713|nr:MULTISPECIES: porin [unclassified Mesorhizobium]TPI48865.1 porin [Mesorhizobium sp. B2-9-1]TPJ27616.1 porin [Mesorhizobium sp. B2-7-2]